MDQMEVAALGRPFTLGMFYDARMDKLIPGLTLWDKQTLKDFTTRKSQSSSSYHIMTSDTIDSKSSLLDIQAGLKASFLGGMIEVGGSAKFLNDHKQFKNQSRVTLQYHATTHFEQLTMTHDKAMSKLQERFTEKGSATHVVTGILYGANAFFVFDSQNVNTSSLQEVEVGMKAMVNLIPSFSVGGHVSMSLNENEQALAKDMSCKFYGDFILETNPATFEDAVKTYVELPKLLEANGSNSIPLKVWLTPLDKFNLKAIKLRGEISSGLLWKAENTLESLKEIRMRCNDSMVEKVVGKLPQLEKNLSTFQKLCREYTMSIQGTMEKKFPAIREGLEDAAAMEKLLDNREKSPFSDENLRKWMENKEHEVTVIQSCVDIINGTNVKIAANHLELEREAVAAGVDHALCFVFTSVQEDDPYLHTMANNLKWQEADPAKTSPLSQNQWYSSQEVRSAIRTKAKEFGDLAKQLQSASRVKFLITVLENPKYKGATVYHYKEGNLVNEDFTRPDPPKVTTVTDRNDFIWYFSDLTLDPNSVQWRLRLSDGNKTVTCEGENSYPQHPDRFTAFYQVMCREKLSGRHYWEVDWSNGSDDDIGVAVAYKSLDRTDGSLIYDPKSWSFARRYGSYNYSHVKEQKLSVPSNDLRRIGVFLDWPAGTVSFYKVTFNTLTHLHTFHDTFTEPLFAAFWASKESSYITLRPFN
ncbi:neoverrucotoxin subunit alpha-like [Sphaeramia orbicularis]|uniref:Neoverrucotoxin subunit alpha-like n=1 Tax=Sphaeramia orbicularis TaxID=375764 RepID=A0A673BHA0_9TELE|nr:neoverrucotoxin subunit alpha-like [Sphaeramia orbicularis]